VVVRVKRLGGGGLRGVSGSSSWGKALGCLATGGETFVNIAVVHSPPPPLLAAYLCERYSTNFSRLPPVSSGRLTPITKRTFGDFMEVWVEPLWESRVQRRRAIHGKTRRLSGSPPPEIL